MTQMLGFAFYRSGRASDATGESPTSGHVQRNTASRGDGGAISANGAALASGWVIVQILRWLPAA